MIDPETHWREDARLRVLVELGNRRDLRLSDGGVQRVLGLWGFQRPMAWVRQQLDHLADLDAVRVTVAGDVRVAELGPSGIDHLQRRCVLDGVKRPVPRDLERSVLGDVQVLTQLLRG